MSDTTYDEAGWLAFRAAREAELRQPHGWLTIAGFAWLPDEPAWIDGLPGRWSTDGESAYVDAAATDGLLRSDAQHGRPIEGRDTKTVAETSRVPWVVFTGPDASTRGDTEVELLRRGGRLAVRWRTETSPDRERFAGVPTYPFDPAWVVTGTFTPYDDDRRVDVATHKAELRQSLRAMGDVSFEIGGEPQRLVLTTIKSGLSAEFHDPTNGAETPAWRQLKIADPAPGGTMTLDFNRTIDMWFAFTDHATCPAPSDGNTLTVPVRAGERTPSA